MFGELKGQSASGLEPLKHAHRLRDDLGTDTIAAQNQNTQKRGSGQDHSGISRA
jgi:hypothetical protein